MSNRLSFAQILQKKQHMEHSHNSQFGGSQFGGSQVKYQKPQVSNMEFVSLRQMIEEYIQDPESPDENFILSFGQMQMSTSTTSQDFGVRENPLDSWIMTQSNFKNNPLSSRSTNKKQTPMTPGSKNTGILEMSKKQNTKQNKNGNVQNVFKFSSKGYGKSMENSQNFEDSQKYYPGAQNSKVNGVKMIGDTKIIQSQVYGYDQCQSKRDLPRMERSEKVENKVSKVPMIPIKKPEEPETKKFSRYQNYQETDRKQPEPEIQREQLIENENSARSKILKKLSEEEENLMAGVQEYDMRTIEQKRIEDAKQQINEYLKIKQKSPESMKVGLKSTKFSKKSSEKQPESFVEKPVEIPANYSFAQNPEMSVGCKDSFPTTKKQLQKICENQQIQQNERMLACIEYTQSEADGDEGVQTQQNYENDFNYRKMEISQSIPERKQKKNYGETNTLEKYLPHNEFSTDQVLSPPKPIFTKQSEKVEKVQQYRIPSNLPQRLSQIPLNTEQSVEEFSEIVDKIDVQPSLNQKDSKKFNENCSNQNDSRKQQDSRKQDDSRKYDDDSMNIMTSDNPKFRQLSSGQLFQSINKQPMPVYHDVSSIDIQEESINNGEPAEAVGNNVLQICSPKKKINSEGIQVPKLNMKISDISSVSNVSNIESALSPLKSSQPPSDPSKQTSHIQSHKECSQQSSINLQAHTSGFIYAMRIGSRNSSFTSDYNVGKHQSFRSSHSSLHIQEESSKLVYDGEESRYGAIDCVDMNKNKNGKIVRILDPDQSQEQIDNQQVPKQTEWKCSQQKQSQSKPSDEKKDEVKRQQEVQVAEFQQNGCTNSFSVTQEIKSEPVEKTQAVETIQKVEATENVEQTPKAVETLETHQQDSQPQQQKIQPEQTETPEIISQQNVCGSVAVCHQEAEKSEQNIIPEPEPEVKSLQTTLVSTNPIEQTISCPISEPSPQIPIQKPLTIPPETTETIETIETITQTKITEQQNIQNIVANSHEQKINTIVQISEQVKEREIVTEVFVKEEVVEIKHEVVSVQQTRSQNVDIEIVSPSEEIKIQPEIQIQVQIQVPLQPVQVPTIETIPPTTGLTVSIKNQQTVNVDNAEQFEFDLDF